MRRFIDWLFSVERISGNGLCPTYMTRWTLLKIYFGSLYLHHFVGQDWSKDHHDHPKRFISIGLWGGYIEEVLNTKTGEVTIKRWRAPWFRSFGCEHSHRIDARETGSWTLVWVGRKQVGAWGFWSEGQWIAWDEYVHGGKGAERKSC